MDQRKRNLIYVCSPRMKENDGMGITLSNRYDIKYYKKQRRLYIRKKDSSMQPEDLIIMSGDAGMEMVPAVQKIMSEFVNINYTTVDKNLAHSAWFNGDMLKKDYQERLSRETLIIMERENDGVLEIYYSEHYNGFKMDTGNTVKYSRFWRRSAFRHYLEAVKVIGVGEKTNFPPNVFQKNSYRNCCKEDVRILEFLQKYVWNEKNKEFPVPEKISVKCVKSIYGIEDVIKNQWDQEKWFGEVQTAIHKIDETYGNGWIGQSIQNLLWDYCRKLCNYHAGKLSMYMRKWNFPGKYRDCISWMKRNEQLIKKYEVSETNSLDIVMDEQGRKFVDEFVTLLTDIKMEVHSYEIGMDLSNDECELLKHFKNLDYVSKKWKEQDLNESVNHLILLIPNIENHLNNEWKQKYTKVLRQFCKNVFDGAYVKCLIASESQRFLDENQGETVIKVRKVS